MSDGASQQASHTSQAFGAVVWQRLWRQKVARVGLVTIAMLVFVGIYAPLIAGNQPLLWVDRAGIRFPFVRGLFNRLLFENGVDQLFNLLLVASPLLAAAWFLPGQRRTHAGHLWRNRLVRWLLLGIGLVFFAALPERLGSAKNPLHFAETIRDYKALAASERAEEAPAFAVFPLRPFSYQETDAGRNLRSPDRTHWLGTDTEGRDVFARIVYGARISLTIGVVAVSIYVLIGVFLGAIAGYFGGTIDLVVSRLIEVMICIPTFFLILTISALIEDRSIFHVMIIIGVTSWTGVARLVRAEFLKHKGLEYVQAAVALGIPWRHIVFGHILPNALSPVLVSATFGVASAILIESSLAFLGVGDLSVASWGETLNAGRVQGELWLVLGPGLAIFIVVSVFNLVGEGLRDALDPKLDT